MKSRIATEVLLAAFSATAFGAWIGSTTPAVAAIAPAATPAATPAAAPAVSAPSAGNANVYKVELIVFKHAAPTTGEDYSAPAEARGFNGRRDNGGATPRIVRRLEESELQMNNAAAGIRANPGLQLLAHAGWIQTATGWPRHTGLPLDQFGINVPDLSGNLYLERGELLHFGADLQLGNAPAYKLSELRKLRYNEKHYIDNPGFGLIVLVSPAR
jgi:hypothetical protein